MAIATNQIVTRTDVQNYFRDNVINVIKSNAYHSGWIPTYSGSAGARNAIPAGDLDAYGNTPDNITLSGGIINGGTVYNVMLTLIRNATRVRNFTSSYIYNGSTQATVSGKAIFKQSLPAIAASYTRNKNGSLINNVTPTNNVSGRIASVSTITALCNNMKSAWQNVCNDRLVYTVVTCHSSCHDSCHGDRSRR